MQFGGGVKCYVILRYLCFFKSFLVERGRKNYNFEVIMGTSVLHNVCEREGLLQKNETACYVRGGGQK